MAKIPTGIVGLQQSRKAPLGTYQIYLVRAISQLGVLAYGAELEKHLTEAGIETERGQVYQACRRLEKRGFLSSEQVPEPKRPDTKHKVTVYAVTDEGKDALKSSVSVYDGSRLFADSQKRRR